MLLLFSSSATEETFTRTKSSISNRRQKQQQRRKVVFVCNFLCWKKARGKTKSERAPTEGKWISKKNCRRTQPTETEKGRTKSQQHRVFAKKQNANATKTASIDWIARTLSIDLSQRHFAFAPVAVHSLNRFGEHEKFIRRHGEALRSLVSVYACGALCFPPPHIQSINRKAHSGRFIFGAKMEIRLRWCSSAKPKAWNAHKSKYAARSALGWSSCA